MVSNKSFNDMPVGTPDDDMFGIAPFAEALAEAFRTLDRPVGATIGLNGPWGSGKTSAVNLIKHYLRPDLEQGKLGIVEFRPWWFKGEEALTLAFLQELRGALVPDLGDRAKKIFENVGRKLLQAGPIVGPVVNLATGGLWGAIAGGATDAASKLFTDSPPLEKTMAELETALATQQKRYLVVVDDIDRLTPDEALQVFKLIKSVGRLPNVMYLAVFDRALAEKAAKARYPSEGAHFLEKIIQASFDLPLPQRDDINNAILHEIEKTCGVPSPDEMQRFWNVFYSAIAPFAELPRHVVRLANALAVTWPPIKDEVNIADFVALEVMRLSEPALYASVKGSKEQVCGVRSAYGGGENEGRKILDMFEAKTSEAGRPHVAEALQRLFPRLENVGYAGDFLPDWDASRRVCIGRHFDKYFRFSLGDQSLPALEISELVAHAADDPFVRQKLRAAAEVTRRNGQSGIPIILDELNVHAKSISPGDVQPLIATLFSLSDEIDLERDEDRSSGFGVGNELRMHWLMRRLLADRPLAERSAIYMAGVQLAPVGWLADFLSSAHRDYHPADGKDRERDEDCLVLESALPELQELFKNRVERASKDGTLIEHKKLAYLLFRWLDFGADEGVAVRAWTASLMNDDGSVAALTRAFMSASYTMGLGMFGLGDRVERKVPRASVKGLERLLDLAIFRARVEQLSDGGGILSAQEQAAVTAFWKAWQIQERGDD